MATSRLATTFHGNQTLGNQCILVGNRKSTVSVETMLETYRLETKALA